MGSRLGPCCACGGRLNVRNIVTLSRRAPTPGRGWGCAQCGLPTDGAIAVVCDSCLEGQVPLKQVCDGHPGDGKRVPIESVTVPFLHDLSRHPELAAVGTVH